MHLALLLISNRASIVFSRSNFSDSIARMSRFEKIFLLHLYLNLEFSTLSPARERERFSISLSRLIEEKRQINHALHLLRFHNLIHWKDSISNERKIIILLLVHDNINEFQDTFLKKNIGNSILQFSFRIVIPLPFRQTEIDIPLRSIPIIGADLLAEVSCRSEKPCRGALTWRSKKSRERVV